MTKPIATEQEWCEERATMGGYNPKWDEHDYARYDESGRYAHNIQHASDINKMASVEQITARIDQLSRSNDPRARLQAVHLAELLKYRIALPDRTWCVVHHYTGSFTHRPWVFSAHYTKANAKLWLPHIRKAYPYYTFKVEQRDQVQPFHLVRLDADPSTCVRRR